MSDQCVIVFVPVGLGRYDMMVNGRAGEYDVDPEDFSTAIRRRRLQPTEVWIEDTTGYRERIRA